MRSMAHKGADALVIADVVYAHIHTLIPTHNYRKICIDIHIRSLCCMWVAVEATWTFRFCCFVFSSDWHHLPASKLQSNAPAAALARAGSLHHNTLRLLYCYYTHVASCIARCKYVGMYIHSKKNRRTRSDQIHLCLAYRLLAGRSWVRFWTDRPPAEQQSLNAIWRTEKASHYQF